MKYRLAAFAWCTTILTTALACVLPYIGEADVSFWWLWPRLWIIVAAIVAAVLFTFWLIVKALDTLG